MITLRLLLAHMIADYALQTDWIARRKLQGWPGLLVHFAIVTVASGILIAGMIPYWWGWTLFLGTLHLLIDQYRTFHARDIKIEWSLPYLLFDQATHLLTISVIAQAAANETPRDVWRLLSRSPDITAVWPFFATLAIFLIWTTAVLELEAVRVLSRLRKTPPPTGILPLDRLFGASERLIAIALLLSPYPALSPAAFLPRLYWCLRYMPGSGSLVACEVRTLVSALATAGVGFALLHLRPF